MTALLLSLCLSGFVPVSSHDNNPSLPLADLSRVRMESCENLGSAAYPQFTFSIPNHMHLVRRKRGCLDGSFNQYQLILSDGAKVTLELSLRNREVMYPTYGQHLGEVRSEVEREDGFFVRSGWFGIYRVSEWGQGQSRAQLFVFKGPLELWAIVREFLMLGTSPLQENSWRT